MRTFLLLGLCLCLVACQGGREINADARSEQAEAPDTSEDNSGDVILDPVAGLLEPTGLGYRVDTYFGQGNNVIHRTAYGINALPVGVDVDGDSSTGNLLGADISVHFFSLLLYANLTIVKLDGAPAPMPLRVEVSVIDPRNLLGLPGLIGVIDPDLRVSLGMDASNTTTPARFNSELQVLDSIFSFLPRFTSANLNTSVDDAQGAVGATLAMYADRSGVRADALTLDAQASPATDLDINVTLTPGSESSNLSLSVAAPTTLVVDVKSFDGPQDQPTAKRDIALSLEQLDSFLSLELSGVDGLNGLEDVDTRYSIATSSSIENLTLHLSDLDISGETGEAYARIRPLPMQLEVVQAADGSLSMDAAIPIDDILFAQAKNAQVNLAGELDPTNPFDRHVIRQFESERGGQKIQLTQVRLGGLRSLQAQLGDGTQLAAKLLSAPLSLREESDTGFQEALIEMLPAEFSLAFPDTQRQLDLRYSASESGPGLTYREQTTEQSTQASVRPLPTSLELCSSSDAECGSHGVGTDTSLLFDASETLTINYLQQTVDARKRIAIDDFQVRKLQFDLGIRSGGKRGYVFFDTDSHAFSGSLLQIDGDDGVALQFSEGSFAEDRYLEYDDFILVEERSGSMRCPGRRELEIRTSGTWIDAGFILDQLCQ